MVGTTVSVQLLGGHLASSQAAMRSCMQVPITILPELHTYQRPGSACGVCCKLLIYVMSVGLGFARHIGSAAAVQVHV